MTAVLASFRRWLGRDGASFATPRWVVVDTETSGLDPQRDRLLAIGAVAVDEAGIRIGDSFEAIVRGAPSGDAANIIVHGIGYGAQANGVPAHDAIAAFGEWAADAPRVAFHADFDRTVLRVASEGVGLTDDGRPWLDLSPLAGALVPEAFRRAGRSLDELLAAFDIECAVRHNAASDALGTAELLLRLRVIAAKQGVVGFEALIRASRARKWLGVPH